MWESLSGNPVIFASLILNSIVITISFSNYFPSIGRRSLERCPGTLSERLVALACLENSPVLFSVSGIVTTSDHLTRGSVDCRSTSSPKMAARTCEVRRACRHEAPRAPPELPRSEGGIMISRGCLSSLFSCSASTRLSLFHFPSHRSLLLLLRF